MSTIYEEIKPVESYNYTRESRNLKHRYYFKLTLEIVRTISVFVIALILIISIGYLTCNFNMIEKFINKGIKTFTNFDDIINTYNPIIGGTLNNFNKSLEYFDTYIMEEKLTQIFNEIEILVKHADNNMNVIKNDSMLALKYLESIQQEIKKLIG